MPAPSPIIIRLTEMLREASQLYREGWQSPGSYEQRLDLACEGARLEHAIEVMRSHAIELEKNASTL